MAEEKKQHVYDERNVKTLSALEHIRPRKTVNGRLNLPTLARLTTFR